MATLDEIVENSLYTEVKKLRDDISIVMDPTNDKIYLKKVLDVFSVPVFEYLKSHTDVHVPRVKIFWEEEDRLVVIEEYIQGTTLEELLESGKDFSGKPFTFDELKRILLELCDGLIFLHNANPPIIHRDIKASNVIITDDGLAKIIDYDAAKQYVKGKKKDTVLIGTQGIAAPEQYGFAQSDERTDIYALGKLMESMFSESAGSDGRSLSDVTSDGMNDEGAGVEKASSAEIQVKDDQVRRIVDKATKLQPELRYKSVQEMKSAIEKLLSPSERGAAKRKKAVMGALAAAVLLLLVSGAVLLMKSSGSKSDNNSSNQTSGNETSLGATLSDATSADATSDDADADDQTDVELKVKYLEGANQPIPSPDDYDMLVVKIDLDNVGEFIGFDTVKKETIFDSNSEDYPVLKNKLHDKGWMHANKSLYYIDNTMKEQRIDPEYGKYRYTLVGDKLDGDLSQYYSFGLIVKVTDEYSTRENSLEFLGTKESGVTIYPECEFTGFYEAKGCLVFMAERLIKVDSRGFYNFNESGVGTNFIDE